MSRIDDLIEQYCPDGVKFRYFSEIAKYIRGVTYGKKDEVPSDEGLRILRSNNISLSTNSLNFDKVRFVAQHVRVRENQKLRAGDILVSAASGSKSHVGKVAYVTKDMDYSFGGFMAVIRPQKLLDNKFLFHLLVGNTFSKYLEKNLASSTINNLSSSLMSKFQVPIPPLKIQTEIVRILDAFTELTTEITTELTTELTARKKQYNYYRDQLLSFEEGEVEWKTLVEVGQFIRGNGMQKKDFVKTGFPAIHYGQLYTKYGLSADKTFTYVPEELANRLRKANKNDLLLATTSETDEDVVKPLAWFGGQAAISGDMVLFRHDQNVKYLAYYFQTEAFQAQKRKYITGTKIRRVSKDNLAKIIVPIPPLAEQARIVAILDKFDALTHSISEGLPREIELRQKQYEHYRDLLLSFPKVETKVKAEA